MAQSRPPWLMGLLFGVILFLAGWFGGQELLWNGLLALAVAGAAVLLRTLELRGPQWKAASRPGAVTLGFVALWWYLGALSWWLIALCLSLAAAVAIKESRTYGLGLKREQ